MKQLKSIFVIFSFCSSLSYGAKLVSYCTLAENSKEVKGQNTEERMPLASVSKLFTALLTVSQNSIDKKIYTQFYYTPVGNGAYDVHVKGGHEPYFSRQALHWMIAKLNEAKITRIRNFTFDENFKYYHDTDKRARIGKKLIDPVSGKSALDAPEPELVQAQLSQNAEVLKAYDKSVKEAQQNGVQLPNKLIFNPEKIAFLKSSEFTQSAKTQKGYVASPDILHMLKLMDWNSNNHAANQFFQLSGGIKSFNNLFYDKLGLQEKDVRFVNGSGQNANLAGDGRNYNEATCSTVVRTVKALKKALEIQNAKLQDAVSVMGGDIGSTVGGKTYTNPTTALSVIAKTGMVGTNVTLAGMISSKTGNHFFFFNVEVNSASGSSKRKAAFVNAEANRARKIISGKLTELIHKLGGPLPIEYKLKNFDLENFEEFGEEAADAGSSIMGTVG